MYSSVRVLRSLLVIVCLSLVILFGAIYPVPADAASPSGQGLTISPPLKELTIGPGLLQATTDVGLTNNTDHDFNASIKVVDFKALDEFGGVSLGQAGIPIAKYGLANWMTLPGGNNIKLAKGQTGDVKVIIQNRTDLTPGGHYGAVVITASSIGAAGNKVSFNQELVSLLFLKKVGGEHYGLQLQSITTGNGFGVPDSIGTRFKSTGNVYVIPHGHIDVTDPGGKLVAKGIINPDSALIMQDTSRQFVTLLNPVASSKSPGRYKITIYYRYDGQTNFATKTIYFNRGALSPRSIAAIAVTAVVLLLIVYKLQRIRQKR